MIHGDPLAWLFGIPLAGLHGGLGGLGMAAAASLGFGVATVCLTVEDCTCLQMSIARERTCESFILSQLIIMQVVTYSF